MKYTFTIIIAMLLFLPSISFADNDAAAYYNRGLTYYIKGQYDRAIEDYNKSISLNPNYAKAYSNRGLASADRQKSI